MTQFNGPLRIGIGGPVGADLAVMDRDAKRMRGERPFMFANLRARQGIAAIAQLVARIGGIAARP